MMERKEKLKIRDHLNTMSSMKEKPDIAKNSVKIVSYIIHCLVRIVLEKKLAEISAHIFS
jgi:hypothetical protein